MTPAPTKILDEVHRRLGKIRKVFGYSVDLKSVERGRMKAWKGYDLPAINYWPEEYTNAGQEYGTDRRGVTLLVEIHDQTRDEPFPDVADLLAADVVTALLRTEAAPHVSDAPDYELGGILAALDWQGYDYLIDGNNAWCGALVRFRAEWIVDAWDLYGLPEGAG